MTRAAPDIPGKPLIVNDLILASKRKQSLPRSELATEDINRAGARPLPGIVEKKR